jgi:hypothetical protein
MSAACGIDPKRVPGEPEDKKEKTARKDQPE